MNKEKEIPPKGQAGFIRKGQIGDWKNHFTPQMNQEWDQWIQHSLEGTQLEFTFE